MLAAALMSFGSMGAWAQALTGTTQYDTDGFKYKILSCEHATNGSTVEVSQNVYASAGAAAMVIKDEVTLNVKGKNDLGNDIDKAVTFKVTSIDDDGFKGVTKATSVVIGANINHIGDGAFENCTGITSITFKANTNVVDIEDDAFAGTQFTELDLTPLSKLATVNKWFGSAYAPGAGDVAGDAVNSYLTTVKFPGSLTAIAANAFGGCEELAKVVFPDNTLAAATVLVINAGAFHGTAIETLDLTKAKIVTLNKLFDSDNVTLKTVNMPQSDKFTTLAENALANCIQLKTVDFTKSLKLKTLNDGCLSNTIINTLDFNKNIELVTLPAKPFVNATTTTNKNLKTVILPWNTAAAGDNKCPVTAISTAFANCEKLTTITNLDLSNVTTIDDGAFANDKALTALTLPTTLTNVNASPFVGCEALATLTFKGNAVAGTAVQIGSAAAIFGTTVDALQTLVIEGDYTGTIKAGALSTCTKLNSLTISEGKTFSGTIEAASIKMDEGANATITFGKITGAIAGAITGPVGTFKTTLTTGEFAPAADFANAIVSGVIDVATIAKISQKTGLVAIGTAEKIVISGDVTVAQDVPAANAALTAIEFNGLLGDGATADIIAATTFNETNAANLQTVKFQPTTAPTVAVFNKNAFHTSAAALHPAEKVTLTTTTAVAALYGDVATVFDANLVNVKFNIVDVVDPVPTYLTVYGRADAEYFYGKMALDPAKKYAINKQTEAGEQVTVYSAFVDASDKKIYMDPLAITNGQYIIGDAVALANSKKAVIIRLKKTDATVTAAVAKVEGGLSAQVEYSETADPSTMRYTTGGVMVNDLQISSKLFSSDFIGTTYVGKTLYAMMNPAKEGKLSWGKVDVDSYLPKEAAFVETAEADAARLSIVWLDGSEDVTGIIERLNDQKFNNDAIYSLQGVRVSAPVKGQIYIKNGKKFFVK